MKVHYGFHGLPPIPSPVVSVGSFDGVHRGHRLLISRLAEIASENRGESVVVTFDPHPRQLLRGENRLLTTLEEKLILLAETELDHVIVVNFTREFSKISADEFMDNYLKERLGAQFFLSGEGHHFGNNRSGNIEAVAQAGLDNQKLIRYDNISSTAIRDAIEQGDMALATDMLAGSYLIITPVTDRSKLLPPPGEYVTTLDGGEPATRWVDRNVLDGGEHQLRIF